MIHSKTTVVFLKKKVFGSGFHESLLGGVDGNGNSNNGIYGSNVYGNSGVDGMVHGNGVRSSGDNSPFTRQHSRSTSLPSSSASIFLVDVAPSIAIDAVSSFPSINSSDLSIVAVETPQRRDMYRVYYDNDDDDDSDDQDENDDDEDDDIQNDDENQPHQLYGDDEDDDDGEEKASEDRDVVDDDDDDDDDDDVEYHEVFVNAEELSSESLHFPKKKIIPSVTSNIPSTTTKSTTTTYLREVREFLPESEELSMRNIFHDDVQISFRLPIMKDLDDERMVAETVVNRHFVLALCDTISKGLLSCH